MKRLFESSGEVDLRVTSDGRNVDPVILFYQFDNTTGTAEGIVHLCCC